MIREKQEKEDWVLINMRKVEHLLGAEFIHNLYNRHISRINSIRFRNTRVEWKSGRVLSYAPRMEWEQLEKYTSERYKKFDKYIIDETRKMMEVDRSHIDNLEKDLRSIDFMKCSEYQLISCFIDIQDRVLGELYQVNLVQIERALYVAVDSLLCEGGFYEKFGKSFLSRVILTQEKTESQKEEEVFYLLVEKVKNSCEKIDIDILMNNHYRDYAKMYCAYGESPVRIESYYNRFEKALGDSLNQKQKSDNSEYLDEIELISDSSLKNIILLMREVGTFRDYNKSRLGSFVSIKFILLDSLSVRYSIDRNELNYYLLSEILELIHSHKSLEKTTISNRKSEGIVFVRSEYMVTQNITPPIENLCKYAYSETLDTVCASAGVVTGIARLVFSKDDAYKVSPGDIMVAIGTDFDLMGAIQSSSGVITEEGGLLSHASVVCRELGIPCGIAVVDATKIIVDGSHIRLDATNGKVFLNINNSL